MDVRRKIKASADQNLLKPSGNNLLCFTPNAHFSDTVLEFAGRFADHERDVFWVADQLKFWC